MKTTACVRGINVSYRKANLVCALIRNKKINDALTILENTSQKTAKFLHKLLASAVANAVNNSSMVAENLYVYDVRADQGKTNKRAMPRAKGSSSAIRKRHTHLTIVLSDDKNQRKIDLQAIKNRRKHSIKTTTVKDNQLNNKKSEETTKVIKKNNNTKSSPKKESK